MSREFCKQQISRLSGLAGWQQLQPEAFSDIIDALWNATASDAESKAVIDEALATAARIRDSGRIASVPLPDEIRAFARGLSKPPPSGGCSKCRGTGWAHSKRMVYDVVFKQQIEQDFSTPCTCRPAPVLTPDTPRPKPRRSDAPMERAGESLR